MSRACSTAAGGHVRIGFDARAISYRGIGTYSRNLLRHFADSGTEVVVFCQDQEKDTMPAVDSFTLVSANMDPLASHSRGAFRSLVEKSKVDLLHVPSSWAPTPLDTPLVATVHDVTPLLYPRSLPLVLRMRYKRQLNHTLSRGEAHHHRLADLAVGAQRLRGCRSRQGAGDPQRGVGAVPARCHRRRAGGGAPPLLPPRALRFLGGRLSAREEPLVPHPGLVPAAAATSPILPCSSSPARREASIASCGERWRSAAGGQGALPRLHPG